MRQFPVQHREILLSCPTAPRHKKAPNAKRRFALTSGILDVNARVLKVESQEVV